MLFLQDADQAAHSKYSGFSIKHILCGWHEDYHWCFTTFPNSCSIWHA